MNNLKKLKLKLLSALLLLLIMVISIAVFTPLGKYAWAAYVNNYSTTANGDVMTAAMWNSLDEDFGGGTAVTVITNNCIIRTGNQGTENSTVSCQADEAAVTGGTWRNGSGTFIGNQPSANGFFGRVEGGGTSRSMVKCCKTAVVRGF